MSEELKTLKGKQKLAAKGATFSLLAAMATMALWGWTPLKTVISGLHILIIFLIFVVFALALTGLSVYRNMKYKAMSAKIADK